MNHYKGFVMKKEDFLDRYVDRPCGTREWYYKKLFHREDGPAVESGSGLKEWWINGMRHREDGPAVEFPDGSKIWYRMGMIHRFDGPAVECAITDKKEWWINGENVDPF